MADTRSGRHPAAVAGAAVTACALVLLPAALPAAAATAFSLADAGVPVGMATDHDRDRYWVVAGGRGGRLTLHAYAADGTAQGRMASRDAVTDVQALAFVDDAAWVGDVGGSRAEVSVWNVLAPWPGTEINHAVRFRLTYPDGPHAAGAILVDADHRIHVVTDGDRPGVYRAPQDPPADGAVALSRVADAPAGVTDGLVLRDGRVALRTATELLVVDPATWATVHRAGLPDGQRGQSLAEAVAGGSVLAAAGPAGEVEAVALPSGTTPRPTAAPSRPPVARVPAAEPEDTRTFDQPGTVAALAGAAGLAAVAMLVVALRR